MTGLFLERRDPLGILRRPVFGIDGQERIAEISIQILDRGLNFFQVPFQAVEGSVIGFCSKPPRRPGWYSPARAPVRSAYRYRPSVFPRMRCAGQ